MSQQPPQDGSVESDAAALRFYQQQLLRGFAEDYCIDNKGAEVVAVRSDRAFVTIKRFSLTRYVLLGWTMLTPIYWFGQRSDLFKSKKHIEIRADDAGNPIVTPIARLEASGDGRVRAS